MLDRRLDEIRRTVLAGEYAVKSLTALGSNQDLVLILHELLADAKEMHQELTLAAMEWESDRDDHAP